MLSKPSSLDLFKEIELLFQQYKTLPHLRITHWDFVSFGSYQFPLTSYSFGNQNSSAPLLMLVAGIHGLERIGVETLLALMKNFFERVSWDQITKNILSQIRFLIFPIANPVGIALGRRSNKNHVDLMRNFPVESQDVIGDFLYGGQTLTKYLPWFRGNPKNLEVESRVFIRMFETEISHHQQIIAIDFHSGFGFQDQLWFPYAYRATPFENLSETTRFFELFEKNYPYHFYKLGPTSGSYIIAGDLWDYLYIKYHQINPLGVFLPITLEMGSWLWVKKNPFQLLNRFGIFHPLKYHRYRRVLRRHLTFFDFCIRALVNHHEWTQLSLEQKEYYWELGLKKWYNKN